VILKNLSVIAAASVASDARHFEASSCDARAGDAMPSKSPAMLQLAILLYRISPYSTAIEPRAHLHLRISRLRFSRSRAHGYLAQKRVLGANPSRAYVLPSATRRGSGTLHPKAISLWIAERPAFGSNNGVADARSDGVHAGLAPFNDA
jgi:hypothetical protein